MSDYVDCTTVAFNIRHARLGFRLMNGLGAISLLWQVRPDRSDDSFQARISESDCVTVGDSLA